MIEEKGLEHKQLELSEASEEYLSRTDYAYHCSPGLQAKAGTSEMGPGQCDTQGYAKRSPKIYLNLL